MTATVEAPKRQKSPKGAKGTASVVQRLPQVNLLPPEVKAARTVRKVKQWLVAMIALALLGNLAVVALAVLAQKAANDELAIEQGVTTQLQAEQSQYAEVPLVLGQIDRVSSARKLGMSTEVGWASYLSAIAATAPEGVALETIQVTSATPMTEPTLAPTSALAGGGVANVTFGASSLTVPDTAAWLEGLATVPGFVDAWFSTVTLTETNETAYYTVSATVQVSTDALANRFAAVEEGQ